MPDIIPLFSAPIFFEEDTGFRPSSDILEYIKDMPVERNGISTTANSLSENTYILNSEVMSPVRNILNHYLTIYKKKVLCVTDDIYITNSWMSVLKKGQHHQKHIHPHSLFSGVLYLNASPDNSPIVFHGESQLLKHFRFVLDYTDFNIFNSMSWSLKVKTGSLIIFPGWVAHEVGESVMDEERVVVGFNSFIRGSLPKQKSGYCMDLNL